MTFTEWSFRCPRDDGSGYQGVLVLRVLIVDDEPLARLRMSALVNDAVDGLGYPLASVVASVDSAVSAEAWLDEHDADLVLLDVQMPGADGLTLAERWRKRSPSPAVVFVTAYVQHAVRAFELDAADYLTKPVRLERLRQALQRVMQRQRLASATAVDDGPPLHLIVQERGRCLRLPLAEILHVRAELKYLTVVTARRHHLLDASLAEIEQRFPGHFLRVHRSALVARGAVRELARRSTSRGPAGGESWAVQLAATGEWLPVSRRQLATVREAIGDSVKPLGGSN